MPSIPNPQSMLPRSLSRYWLLLGTAALAIAGLFSLVLVVARTPQLAKLPYFTALFHKALVVHVDLSVLVWFLCIACMLWSALASEKRSFMPYLEEAALVCFALGIAMITLSPFDGMGEALMSNYIPVIHSPVFFAGLGLIGCGTLLMLARLVTGLMQRVPPHPSLHFALLGAGLITFLSLMTFISSYQKVPAVIEGVQYYELLFWGGGHILQFTHTQIMMLGWLLLAMALKPDLHPNRHFLTLIFSIGIVAAFAMISKWVPQDIASQEYRQFYTHIMIAAGGIAPVLLALVVIPAAWRARGRNALYSSLSASLVLFIYGGALGGMIEGQNVVIPAHYHGSIVGVTLAFMGIAYLYLPRFGYRDPSAWKLAYWQPIVYGTGQVMHISGLAWSGGYGVLRKTPGEIANISLSVKAALGFMGLGGLIAIAGGIMFVVVVYRAALRAKPISA